MTRNELLKVHADLALQARQLMAAKNDDYADDDSPFGNLDLIEALTRGRLTTETGIVIRKGDKLSRLATACRRELTVKDEGVVDSILDDINYSVLFAAKHMSRSDMEIDYGPERVYVAGPYSNGDQNGGSEREENTRRAVEAGIAIAKRGHFVHVPHAATAPFDGHKEYEWFMQLDFGIIARWATCIFRVPGASPGADREAGMGAQMGLPVLTRLEQLPDLSAVKDAENAIAPTW